MKVIGINASPRKKGNTQTLVEAVLDGAAGKGAEIRMVHLRDLDIHGCMGCEGCKKQLGKCVQKDDLSPLLQEMAAYDAIVLGTPVYWYHVTAQFKIFIDRLYSFFNTGVDPQTGKETYESAFPAGRKLLFVISRGDSEPTKIFPQLYSHLDEWLNMIPLILRTRHHEIFHQYGASLNRKAAQKNAQLLERAGDTGANLVSSD